MLIATHRTLSDSFAHAFKFRPHAYLSPIAIALLLYTYLYTALSSPLSFFGTCLWPGVHDQKHLAIYLATFTFVHIPLHYIRSFDVFIVYFLALRLCANFLFTWGSM